MGIAQLLTRPLTQTKRRPDVARDAHGNALLVETTVATVGYLEQLATVENLAAGQQSEATHRLFLGPGADVAPTDRFTVDGTTFDVVGLPDHQWNPRTRLEHHVEVSLRRSEGM